jgi:hypothetical protein
MLKRGRPRNAIVKGDKILTAEEWLREYIAEPQPADDVIAAAGELNVSERNLDRIKARVFHDLNEGLPDRPWKAFHRGKCWYWGDERMFPKPQPKPKRHFEDGSTKSLEQYEEEMAAWRLQNNIPEPEESEGIPPEELEQIKKLSQRLQAQHEQRILDSNGEEPF